MNENNNLFDQIKKYKKIAKIIGLISPVIIPFLMVILVMAVTFYTTYVAYNQVGVVIEGAERLNNFITMNGWSTNQEAFFNNLQTEYNWYHSYSNKKDELDIALISATIHYGKLINPNVWEKESPGEGNSSLLPNESIISTLKTANFYGWANNELGQSKTLFLTDRGLVGALISYNVVSKCIDSENILDNFKNLIDGIIDSAQTLWQTSKSVNNWVWGNTIRNYFDYSGTLGNMTIFEYVRLMYEKGKSSLTNVGYDISNVFQITGEVNCTRNQKVSSTITAYNDYEKYKSYLRTYFIKEYYINCENCQYKNYSDEDKAIKTEQIIGQIFDQRDEFVRLFNLEGTLGLGGITEYIPGMESLPLTLPASGKYNYTSYYSDSRDLTGIGGSSKDIHTGLDFGANEGTPVYAIADGVVTSTVTYCKPSIYDFSARSCGGGYGNNVRIGHDFDGDGKYDYYTIYAHLSLANVVEGQKIGGGQKVGEVGITGNTTGAHLHLEVRDSNNKHMNPLPIINGIIAGKKVFET